MALTYLEAWQQAGPKPDKPDNLTQAQWDDLLDFNAKQISVLVTSIIPDAVSSQERSESQIATDLLARATSQGSADAEQVDTFTATASQTVFDLSYGVTEGHVVILDSVEVGFSVSANTGPEEVDQVVLSVPASAGQFLSVGYKTFMPTVIGMTVETIGEIPEQDPSDTTAIYGKLFLESMADATARGVRQAEDNMIAPTRAQLLGWWQAMFDFSELDERPDRVDNAVADYLDSQAWVT